MARYCFSIKLLGLLLLGSQAWAQDSESTHDLSATITGNQEQPKVLYIVPWKNVPEAGAIPYRPISSQTDKVFRHIERSEHLRQLEFLQAFADEK